RRRRGRGGRQDAPARAGRARSPRDHDLAASLAQRRHDLWARGFAGDHHVDLIHRAELRQLDAADLAAVREDDGTPGAANDLLLHLRLGEIDVRDSSLRVAARPIAPFSSAWEVTDSSYGIS